MPTTLPFRILLVLLAILMAAPAVMAAQTASPVASPVVEDGLYHDPDGRYSVPVPTNWAVSHEAGFAVLTDPDDTLSISILVIFGPDAGPAIDAAWEIADPSTPRAIDPDVVDSPSGPGIDETVIVTDDYGDESGQIRQAIALRVGDETFVLIAVGSLEAAVQRASQTQIILGGFQITALTEATPTAAALAPFTGSLVDDFNAYVTDLLARLEVPGASIAVVADGEVVFAEGYGVAEIGGTQPVGPDTMMMIGSTNKALTTMMVASAIDDGFFTWDTPVIELYPEFALSDPELTRSLTIRDLFCACTGVPRQDFEFALNGQMTAEEVIASMADIELYTDFGEAFQYSNQMVAAGGYIAAGAEYPDQDLTSAYLQSVQERVLDAIGMDRTTFSLTEVGVDPDHAIPHGTSVFEGYVPVPLGYEQPLLPIAPAGGAWSTANDMAAYLITQMQRGLAPSGEQVVSPANLTETWQPGIAVDATTAYGLGWLVGEIEGHPAIWHDGNTFGFTAQVAFLPESQVGIVILANAQGANLFTEGVRARFLELLTGTEPTFDTGIQSQLEIAEVQFASILEQIGERPDASVVTDIIGTYTNESLGELTLSHTDAGGLIVATGEFEMEARPVVGAPVRALVLIDPPLALTSIEITEQDGATALIVVEGLDERVFTRVEDTATPIASPET